MKGTRGTKIIPVMRRVDVAMPEHAVRVGRSFRFRRSRGSLSHGARGADRG